MENLELTIDISRPNGSELVNGKPWLDITLPNGSELVNGKT